MSRVWSASSAGSSLRKAFNSICKEGCRDKLGHAAAEYMVPGTPGQGSHLCFHCLVTHGSQAAFKHGGAS